LFSSASSGGLDLAVTRVVRSDEGLDYSGKQYPRKPETRVQLVVSGERKKKEKREEEQVYGPPPAFLCCQISGELMSDPVIASDGHTYDRLSFEEWIKSSNDSPVTGQPLDTLDVRSNFSIRSMINEQLW
jgi:hypothetical protein